MLTPGMLFFQFFALLFDMALFKGVLDTAQSREEYLLVVALFILAFNIQGVGFMIAWAIQSKR